MKKTELMLGEILELEAELNGLIDQKNQKVVIEGLLSKDLNLTLKYWISKLADKAAEEKTKIGKMREDLIKKHGKADEEGNISIPTFTNEVKDDQGNIVSAEYHPDYIKFNQDYANLLQEKVTVKHKEFKLDDFSSISSKDFPKVFFKLIDVPEEEEEVVEEAAKASGE